MDAYLEVTRRDGLGNRDKAVDRQAMLEERRVAARKGLEQLSAPEGFKEIRDA